MAIPAFDPKELTVVDEIPVRLGRPPTPIYSYPVTPREAYIAHFNRKPIWHIMGGESRLFAPKLLPDNVSRAMVMESQPFDGEAEGGGPDMFSIDWEYVPTARGSIVRPGKPHLADANDWREKIQFPDIDKWDWEGTAAANNDTYFVNDLYNVLWFQTGWFERLVSFMDFEGALLALIDEDQKDAAKELFNAISELYIRIFDKFLTYFPRLDGFIIHDDWGAQKEAFFSPSVCEEMVVPAMRKVTDWIHAQGKYAELHSCGQILKQVPNMIAAGWDAWSGQHMNDTHKIYEMHGDKILIGVVPVIPDSETASEEELRAAAREYAEKFCNPDKPSYLNAFGVPVAFREELYIQSRKNYSGTK